MHPKAVMEWERQSLESHKREAELTQRVETMSKEIEVLRHQVTELWKRLLTGRSNHELELEKTITETKSLKPG